VIDYHYVSIDSVPVIVGGVLSIGDDEIEKWAAAKPAGKPVPSGNVTDEQCFYRASEIVGFRTSTYMRHGGKWPEVTVLFGGARSVEIVFMSDSAWSDQQAFIDLLRTTISAT
jgi:hypothetical protein